MTMRVAGQNSVIISTQWMKISLVIRHESFQSHLIFFEKSNFCVNTNKHESHSNFIFTFIQPIINSNRF